MKFLCQTFCSWSNTQCRFPFFFAPAFVCLWQWVLMVCFFFRFLKNANVAFRQLTTNIWVHFKQFRSSFSTSSLWSKDFWTSVILHLSGKKTVFWKLHEEILNGVYSPHAVKTIFYLNFSGSKQAQMGCICLCLGLVQSEWTKYSPETLVIIHPLILYSCSSLYTVVEVSTSDSLRSASKDNWQNI